VGLVNGVEAIRGTAEARPGKVAIHEQWGADGVRFMFGNPGTVEQGFLDTLEQSSIEYILTLQETVAVGTADGYARATGGPALVQLHSGVGLGNGIGMIHQAKRRHSPLIVVAGSPGSPTTRWMPKCPDASSVTACRLTATWQLLTLPKVPEYCRATPGEAFPLFANPVSSITHACGPTKSMTIAAGRRRTAT
jgi:thiamine pyrophosphate-dependent enzyme